MPVFDKERRTTMAWFKGQAEGERAEREKIRQEEEEARKQNYINFEELINKSRKEKEEKENDQE